MMHEPKKFWWFFGPAISGVRAVARSRDLNARVVEAQDAVLREIDNKLRDIESRIEELE
jgi:hypothetical protein